MGERCERSASGKDVTALEDKEILALYWARSEQAIQETGRKYGAPVGRVARNILGDEQAAEDVPLPLARFPMDDGPRFGGESRGAIGGVVVIHVNVRLRQ